MSQASDATVELLGRIKSGDSTARNLLFERVRGSVIGIVRRRMGERMRARYDSEDIAQSVLADAVRNLDRFEYRDDGALHAWLATYVENKLRQRARGLQYGDRAPERVMPIGPADSSEDGAPGHDPSDHDPSPSTMASDSEQRERLRAALDGLPQRERVLIELRDLEQLDWDEIVSKSGEATKKAAQQCYARGVARLAAELLRGEEMDGSE